MTEKLFKEIMKRSKLRNIFLRNRTEVNKIFYNRQRNYCVSLLWKSKKGYGENQKQPPRCSVKKGVLRNFAKFTGKHLCQRLFFNKVAKKRLWHRCFHMIFEKFSFLTELPGWLLLQYPPFNVGKQLCESLILSKLDYYNILFKSLPKYQKIRVGKLLWAYAGFVKRK